ncbi:MAG: barstar family protein [Paludibacteraceae bacterium]
MKQVIFDFDSIRTMDDFYREAELKLDLPDYFGNNLDAIWDSLTAYIELPVFVEFINMTMQKMHDFAALILLFEDASDELVEDFFFEFSLKDEMDM